MDPAELIKVTRWIDGDAQVALTAKLGERPVLPAAWANGDVIHASVAGFEFEMPTEVWEALTGEVRHAIATRDLTVGGGWNIVGKDARHVRANTAADVILGGQILDELTDALRRHPSAGVTEAGSAAALDELAARRRGER